MGLSNYQHLFCHFCKSPMDDDETYFCIKCAIEDQDRSSWWDDEREEYILKDEIVDKYMKVSDTKDDG